MPRVDAERELMRFDKATLIAWILEQSAMVFHFEAELERLRRLRGEKRLDAAKTRMDDALRRMRVASKRPSVRAHILWLEASEDYDRASREFDRALEEAYPRRRSAT